MTTKKNERCVIIGNSVAALGCVRGIREVDDNRSITLLAMEPHHTYSKPLITYLLGGVVDEGRMPIRPVDYYEKNGVCALFGTEATGLDTKSREVVTADGRRLPFDQLLIATGGKPIVPGNVSGVEAQGVFTFTTLDDARNIKAYIEANNVRKAVVVGGGLIGLKSVEALTALKIDTTLVELADRILSVTFDDKASAMARASLERAGVTVLCGTTVTQVGHRNGKVASVILRDGASVDASMIIFAIGVSPNLDVVRDTPIEVDRGILVDDRMQTNVPGVYAAGDVAQARDLLTGERRLIPILPTASRQGIVAGRNMAGEAREYDGGLAMNAVDICGLPTISVGRTNPSSDDCEVLIGNGGDDSYKKIVICDNRIVGAIFIGQIDRAGIITGLIKNRVDVSGFKDLLLMRDFGLISLPAEYRKHMVSSARVAL